MQSLEMVLHFSNSYTYECLRKHLGAAGLSRSFLTFRRKNQRTCRHCPGVSQHMTPYPVFSNLTISSWDHTISRIKSESISLTCGTLDFPTKCSWNLKTSLSFYACLHASYQTKSWVFGLNKMEEALVMLKHSCYHVQLFHRTDRVLWPVQWQPVHLMVYSLWVSTGGKQEDCFHKTLNQFTARPSQQLQLKQIAKAVSANTMCHSGFWFAFGCLVGWC